MNQMTTYILLITGLSILFFAMGINTNANPLLNYLINPQGAGTWILWSSITLAIALVGTANAFSLGTVFKNVELAAMTVIYLLLATQLFYFSAVISILLNNNKLITILIFSPLLILLIFSLVEYWRGRD